MATEASLKALRQFYTQPDADFSLSPHVIDLRRPKPISQSPPVKCRAHLSKTRGNFSFLETKPQRQHKGGVNLGQGFDHLLIGLGQGIVEIVWGVFGLLAWVIHIRRWLKPLPSGRVKRASWACQTTSRALVGLVISSLVVTTPVYALRWAGQAVLIQDQVLSQAHTALASIDIAQEAIQAQDLPQTTQALNQAMEAFVLARQQLDQAHGVTAAILRVLPPGETGQQLLELGTHLTFTATELTYAFKTLSSEFSVTKRQTTTALASFLNRLNSLKPRLALISELTTAINDKHLPSSYRAKFQLVRDSIPDVQSGFSQMISFGQHLLQILGHDQARRYLVVFQNSQELRATGGFWGSFALVDIDQGRIKKLEIPGGGTYSIQGQLSVFVQAPKPLQLINPRWEFQDVNWFPDFPASAEKARWFYEKAGGPTVDGVVAINSDLLPQLLKITGPLTLPSAGLTVEAETVLEVIRQEVDQAKLTQEPKQIISELVPILLQKLINQSSPAWLEILNILGRGFKERNIQVYFAQSQLQAWAQDYGLTGQIRSATDDYLMLVDSNIRGGKTNGVISQKLDHVTEIQPNGGLINTVTVTRRHAGTIDQKNYSYLRLYVPAGSKLEFIQGDFLDPAGLGFEKFSLALGVDPDLARLEESPIIDERFGTRITQEFGKTVFGNYVAVKPGETVKLVYRYRLPKNWGPNWSVKRYSLLIQKQSGLARVIVTSSLRRADGVITPAWAQADGLTLSSSNGAIQAQGALTQDVVWGTVVK